jgi:hypothetical protein
LTKLQQAARCAIADIIGFEIKSEESDRTVIELIVALKEEGVDVSDYDTDRIEIENRVNDYDYE